MAKYKKRITLYDVNPENQVPEMQLVSGVAAHLGMSTEDFIRGAALQSAARHLYEMDLVRKQAEAAYVEASKKQDAALAASTEGIPDVTQYAEESTSTEVPAEEGGTPVG